MYSGLMCGLCGYFDQNPDNEKKLGSAPYNPTTTTQQFGDYYEVKNISI